MQGPSSNTEMPKLLIVAAILRGTTPWHISHFLANQPIGLFAQSRTLSSAGLARGRRMDPPRRSAHRPLNNSVHLEK
jgi:hypothetical protein